MKMYTLILGGAITAVMLSGCGGDSSSSAVSLSTGVFIDSPVINIGYRTETVEGVTNSLGEYNYIVGETVTFFIGDLVFPTVSASGVVTPLQLADTEDTSDPTVVNIIRLLQTLDVDGDPSNGIEISDTAALSATQIDFNVSVNDFEHSNAVQTFIANAGQNVAVTELVSAASAIQHFENTLDENYSVILTEVTASSLIQYSACPDISGGWDYSFTATSMGQVGTDAWDSFLCTMIEDLSQNTAMTALASDSDVPFNCVDYPVCRVSDFNKTLSGVDEDDRPFTSTYTFNRAERKITYTKSVLGGLYPDVYTEVITLHDGYSIDLVKDIADNHQVGYSTINYSECPSLPGGWIYGFVLKAMYLQGSDSWETMPECVLNPNERIRVDTSAGFDIPFSCEDYPVCTSADLNKRIADRDEDGREFISTYSYSRLSRVLTYTKVVEDETFTEVIGFVGVCDPILENITGGYCDGPDPEF